MVFLVFNLKILSKLANKCKIMRNLLSFFFFMILSSSINAQILNIENFRIKTDTVGWSGKIGLNFSLTKNTKSLTNIGSNIHVQYKSKKNLYLILSNYNLLVSDKQDLINKAVIHLRHNYKINRILRSELFFQAQNNSISKIELRTLIGAGLRYKLSKKETKKFYLGTTIMYEHEKIVADLEPTSDILRLSSYFSFNLYLDGNLSWIGTTYYQPAIKNFNDYRIATQSSLTYSFTKKLAFKTKFSLNYDAFPVNGIPQTDYNLSSGIVYYIK
jgi:putative salt-induced outer membrane protein YdiY